MLTVIVILLLLISIGVSAWGYSRYGMIGWSPVGFVFLLILVLLLTDTFQVAW